MRIYSMPNTILRYLTGKILFKPSCGSLRLILYPFSVELIEAER